MVYATRMKKRANRQQAAKEANPNPKKKASNPKKNTDKAERDVSDEENDPRSFDEKTTLASLTPAQMQTFMDMIEKAGGKVTPAGRKECDEKEAQPKKKKASPPQEGEVAHNSEEAQPEASADQLLQLCLQGQTKKAKKGMENLIREVIRSKLYRIIKLITGKEVQDIAVRKVRVWLNFSSLQGNDAATKRRIKEFDDTYGPVVTKLLNEHRSYVSSQLKEVMHKNWEAHGRSLPSKEQLLKLIGRDFALAEPPAEGLDEEDYGLLRWWITEVLPKACGTQSEWGPEHHYYMTVQKGAPAKRPKSYYVTPSTEAFAVWVIENNREAWPAQWAAKIEFGNYGIIRKTKGPNKEKLTSETSVVSILTLLNLALIWLTFHLTDITFWSYLLIL